MKIIFNVLLLAFLASSMQCSKKNKADNKEDTTEMKEVVKEGNKEYTITLDSAEIMKYLDHAEKKELGPSMYRIYNKRDFHLAWWSNDGMLSAVPEFISRLETADEDGLNPDAYGLEKLKALFQKIKDEKKSDDADYKNEIKNFDLLLTSTFLEFSADMKEGVTRAQKEKIGWLVNESKVHYDRLFDSIMNVEMKDPFALLNPPHIEYGKLKELLKQYRQLEAKGGWPALKGVEKLKLGDTSKQVSALREHLFITGDLKPGVSNVFNPEIFDKNLELGVKNFQTRLGLIPDGVVGGNVIAALNVDVKDRIKQVIVNMERWRLVPPFNADDYLVVNVPEFRLHIFQNKKEAFNMRVIVGKDFKATPIFSDTMKNVVFSPYWNIPKSIIAEEILPAMQKDGSYLSRHNMEAMKGFGKDAMPVRAWEVPWYNINKDNFQYWIRQKPGVENPLGLVKFLFPNSHNVYLHDTPSDGLFSQVKRTYSHGCIRVEHPKKLAEFVLNNQPEWTESKITEAMNADAEQWVNCRKLPVYILYFTTWVDEAGKVQIRDDIYGLDKITIEQMNI